MEHKLIVVALLMLTQQAGVMAFDDLNGAPCGKMSLKQRAFNYYERQHFLKAVQPDPGMEHRDWLVRDLYSAHLGPAIKTMDSELGTGIGGSVSGNLAYTLATIPNHPKALHTVIEYSFRIKKRPRHKPLHAKPECYLQRAMEFAKRDPGPRLLFGLYLHRLEKYEQALKYYDAGIELAPNSSEGLYNRGLALFKLGRYEAALDDANRAYALGFPLRGLARMLKAKGHSIKLPARAVANKP